MEALKIAALARTIEGFVGVVEGAVGLIRRLTALSLCRAGWPNRPTGARIITVHRSAFPIYRTIGRIVAHDIGLFGNDIVAARGGTIGLDFPG